MAIRYIADMHFDNDSIIAYDNRPFNSVGEMNSALIRNWNRVTSDDDLTWILGDFCAGDARRWISILGELKGRKAFVTGNHDDPASISAAADLFEEVCSYREFMDENRHVVLSHYPIPAFRDHYFGWYHLYGHVHTAFEWNIIENTKRLIKNLYVREDVCRMANAGAMVPYMDYTPRTLDAIFSAV